MFSKKGRGPGEGASGNDNTSLHPYEPRGSDGTTDMAVFAPGGPGRPSVGIERFGQHGSFDGEVIPEKNLAHMQSVVHGLFGSILTLIAEGVRFGDGNAKDDNLIDEALTHDGLTIKDVIAGALGPKYREAFMKYYQGACLGHSGEFLLFMKEGCPFSIESLRLIERIMDYEHYQVAKYMGRAIQARKDRRAVIESMQFVHDSAKLHKKAHSMGSGDERTFNSRKNRNRGGFGR